MISLLCLLVSLLILMALSLNFSRPLDGMECCLELPIYRILEWISKGFMRFGVRSTHVNPLNKLSFFMLK